MSKTWDWDESWTICPPEPSDITTVYDDDGWEYNRDRHGIWTNSYFPLETFTWEQLMSAYSPLHEENPR